MLSMPTNWLKRLEIVEDIIRQVDLHTRGIVFKHGRDENAIAVEELRLDGEGVCVLGVDEKEWV